MITMSFRMVGWKILQLALAVSAKHGGVGGTWQAALTEGFVEDKISALRTQLAVASCLRRMRHLSDEERAAAICELTSEEWRSIEAAVMRSIGDSMQSAGRVIAAAALLFFSGCASHETPCAFDLNATYTMSVVDASNVPPQVGTLACLFDQDTGDDCVKIVPMCDGESLTLTSPRFPDRRFTLTVKSADADGIVAHFGDAQTGYDVRLQEI